MQFHRESSRISIPSLAWCSFKKGFHLVFCSFGNFYWFFIFSLGIIYDGVYLPSLTSEDITKNNDSFQALFYFDSTHSSREIERGLISFVEKDIKVINLLIYGGHAKVICAALNADLFSEEHVWFTVEWAWSQIVEELPDYCTEEQISYLTSLDGLFALEPNPKSIEDKPTDVMLTTIEYNEEIKKMLIQDFGEETEHNPNFWDLYVYDLMWITAMNINATLEGSNQAVLETFLEQLDSTTFYGVTGHVGFENYNSRWPQFKFLQFEHFDESKFIAQVSPDSFEYHNAIDWVQGKVPLDHTPEITVIRKVRYESINGNLALGFDILAGCVGLFLIAVATINNLYRKNKMIKLTSPSINNVTLMGASLFMVCAILLSAKVFSENEDLFLWSCYGSSVTVCLGFTLLFGALFGKTWRVYKVFGLKSIQKVTISDLQILLYILMFVCFDAVVISVWFFFSPLYVLETKTELDTDIIGPNEITETQWILRSCATENSFFGYILIGFKSLLLLFGGFLAFETRSVHIDVLNDSRSIAVSIYNIAISCLFGGLVFFYVNLNLNVNFVVQSAVLFFCSLFPVIVIFLPRQIKVIVHGDEAEKVAIRKTPASVTGAESPANGNALSPTM